MTENRKLHLTDPAVWDANISRRQMLAGMGALSASLALAGCTLPGQGSSAKPQVSLITFATDPASHGAFTEISRNFEKTSGIKVNDSYIAGAQYSARLPTQLSSGSPPDIFMSIADGAFFDFVKKGLVADITDLYNTDLAPNFPKSFSVLGQLNGKQYAVCIGWFWYGFFYNKALFDQHGFKEPKTWDEFMSLLAQIKKAGVVPIAVGAKTDNNGVGSYYFENINLRINGPDFASQLAAGKIPYTDPRVTRVFDLFKQVQPYIGTDSGAYNWVEAGTKVANGSAAMTLIGPWIIGALGTDFGPKFGQFFFPQIDSSVISSEQIGVAAFSATAKAPNLDGAKKLLAYLGSADAGTIYVKATNSTSSAATNTKVDPSVYSKLFADAIAHINGLPSVVSQFTTLIPPDMWTAFTVGADQFIQQPNTLPAIIKSLESARGTAYSG